LTAGVGAWRSEVNVNSSFRSLGVGLLLLWALQGNVVAASLVEVAPAVSDALLDQDQHLDGVTLSGRVELTWFGDMTNPATESRIYRFQLCFHKWGYFAELVRQDKGPLDDYRFPFKSVSIRSNSYSLDISIKEQVKWGAARSPSDNHAFVWDESQPSFVPMPLLPGVLRKFLLGLSSVEAVKTNDAQVGGIVQVLGEAELGGMTESWELSFAEEHRMFPVVTKVYLGGELVGSSSAEFPVNTLGSYYPSSYRVVTYQKGRRVFSHEFREIRLERTASGCPTDDQIAIPPMTLVNDYRFGDGTAYYMGSSPPSDAQLREMGTNTDAIAQYQHFAFVPSPVKSTSYFSPRRRLVVVSILVGVALSSGFLLLRRRKRSVLS